MDLLILMTQSETRIRQNVRVRNPRYQVLCTRQLGMYLHKHAQHVKIPQGSILRWHRLQSQSVSIFTFKVALNAFQHIIVLAGHSSALQQSLIYKQSLGGTVELF